MPTNRWIKQMWCIFTMDYNVALKKNKITPFTVTQVQLERISLSQSEEGNTVTSLICGISHMAQMNHLQNRKRLTDTHK